MDQIKQVEIDAAGRFKYVLLRIVDRSSKQERLCVRGSLAAAFHADLVDVFEEKLRKLKIAHVECRCIGGGRIYVNPDERTLNVYGYSQVIHSRNKHLVNLSLTFHILVPCHSPFQGYGRADHEITCEILRNFYPDYAINWSNEGY
jgi:hypothetical protein